MSGSSIPAASTSAPSTVEVQGSAATTPTPPVAAPAPLTTDLRIDNQHQFYYEFVDGSTGNVVFEIPPEALRAIGESLNLPLDTITGSHSLDVKS